MQQLTIIINVKYSCACEHDKKHREAKLFPVVHCYGTGSIFAEIGSGNPLGHVQSRATSIQSWFRRSSTWGFFQSDSQTKRSLFFKYRFRVKSGLGNANPASNFERAFGTVIPSSIPVRWGVVSNRCAAHNNGSVQESTAWWRRQGKELAVRAWVALRSCFRYRKLSMRARAAHESTNCMTAKRQIKIDR